jgi:uncharacterized protein YodC (DUF2158 family)
MEQFNIGDVVRMKSGGPKMTILRYGYDDDTTSFLSVKDDRSKVICEWFDGTTKKQGEFAVTSLEKV